MYQSGTDDGFKNIKHKDIIKKRKIISKLIVVCDSVIMVGSSELIWLWWIAIIESKDKEILGTFHI